MSEINEINEINEITKKLFNDFHNNNKNISNKQILYLKKIFNNVEFNNIEFNKLLQKYNCNSIYQLKYYQVDHIIKSQLFINNDEIYLLNKFFSEINDIYNIFKENPYYDKIYEKYLHLKESTYQNSKYYFLSKIKKKDIKYIYSKYPQLTILNNKYKLYIKSSDIPISCSSEYEYGYQIKKNNNNSNSILQKFYYIKFYNWATFDIDNQDYNFVNDILNKIINISNNYVFALYKTNNGFHIHIMNKLIEYNSIEYKYLSEILNNDIWYYNYSKIIGYKIRLSKKFNNDIIAKFIKYYIPSTFDKKIIHPKCLKYKLIYEKLITKFLNH